MLEHCPQFVPQEVCLSCDGCCRFKDSQSPWRPKLAEEEKRGGLAQKIFTAATFDTGNYLKTVEERHVCRCQFFNLQKNTCGIYPHRPFECRLYPFVLHKSDGKIVMSVHLNCPHVQETDGTEPFKRFVDGELRRFFQEASILEFLKRNPAYAGQYPEFKYELKYLFTVC